MLYQLVSLKTHGMKNKNQGALSIIEGTQDAPFEIKRIYYIHGVKAGERRGHHAHKALWQLLFCPYGKIRINIETAQRAPLFCWRRPRPDCCLVRACGARWTGSKMIRCFALLLLSTMMKMTISVIISNSGNMSLKQLASKDF